MKTDFRHLLFLLTAALALPAQAGIDLYHDSTVDTDGVSQALALEDMNGDGLADAVVAEDGLPGIVVHLSDSLTTREYLMDGKPVAVVVDDFDDSDTPDIAAIDSNNEELVVILLDGDGDEISRHTFATGALPVALAVANLNDDAYPELLVVDADDDDLIVYLGDDTDVMLPQTAISTGNYPVAMAVADFDQDTYIDVYVLNVVDSSITRLFGAGDGSLTAAAALDVPVESSSVDGSSLPFAMVAGLVDDDAYPDLVVGSLLGNSLRLFLNDGLGGVDSIKFVTHDWRELGLSYSNDGAGDVEIHEYVDSLEFNVPSRPLQLVDMDGDDLVDLVASSVSDDKVRVFYGSTEGFSDSQSIDLPGAAWSISVGDAIGDDDRPEIAVSMPVEEGIAIISNMAAPTSAPRTSTGEILIEECTSAAAAFEASDPDGDSLTFTVDEVLSQNVAEFDAASGSLSIGNVGSGYEVSMYSSTPSGMAVGGLDESTGTFELYAGSTGSLETAYWLIRYSVSDGTFSSTGSVAVTVSGDGSSGIGECLVMPDVSGLYGIVYLNESTDVDDETTGDDSEEVTSGTMSETESGASSVTTSGGGAFGFLLLLGLLLPIRRRSACG